MTHIRLVSVFRSVSSSPAANEGLAIRPASATIKLVLPEVARLAAAAEEFLDAFKALVPAS
jgi:hypothetical protein